MIKPPKDVTPYPASRAKINDVPESDPANNFGCIARIGVMDEWIRSFNEMLLLGIPVKQWRDFFKR